jgi:hypothetical protein
VDAFAHLAVLISITLGLGLSHLLSRVGEMVQARARHGARGTIYWVQMVWVLSVLLAHVQLWWGLFGWARLLPRTSFFQFLLVLTGPVTLFLASRVVLPDLEDEPTVDLKGYFFAIRPWFFSILALYPIVAALTMVALHDWRWSASRGVQLALSALLFSGAVVRSERYHRVLAAGVLAIILLFITAFSLRIV